MARSGLPDSTPVRSVTGKRGTVHYLRVWGKRDLQPYVRFRGRLHYWSAGPMALMVRKAEAQR